VGTPGTDRQEANFVNKGIGQSPNGAIAGDARSRALAIWPGLDRTKLARTCGDPNRVARLVERRTSLPREAILGMLGVRPPRDG